MKARSYYHMAARLIVSLVAVLSFVPVMAQDSQQYALYNYRNDGAFNAWLNIDIDSITYSCVEWDSWKNCTWACFAYKWVWGW